MSIARVLMGVTKSGSGPSLGSHVYMNGGVSIPTSANDVKNLTTNTHNTGDMLIAMTFTTGGYVTLPGFTAFTTGRTKFGTTYLNQYCTLQYKIADSSSESVSFTGYGGYLLSFANATAIGTQGFYQAYNDRVGGVVIPIPAMSGLNTGGDAMIVACDCYAFGITAADAPYSIDTGYVDCVVNVEKNTEVAISGKTFTRSSSGTPISFSFELLP